MNLEDEKIKVYVGRFKFEVDPFLSIMFKVGFYFIAGSTIIILSIAWLKWMIYESGLFK